MTKYYYTKIVFNLPYKPTMYDLFDWCEKMFGARDQKWWYTDIGLFQFTREEDRAMFILYASGLDCVKRVETGLHDYYTL